MKNIILIGLFLASNAFAAVEADLVHGVDLTAKATVSGALLNQLVDNAVTAAQKGLVIRQATTPDIANNPRYTNFLWLDMSTVPPILKCYDGTNWVTSIQAAGSVGNVSIAGSAVTGDKIASRTIQRTNLALLSVSGQEIDFGTINHGNMGLVSVGRDNLIAGSVNSSILTNKAVATTNIDDLAVGTAQIADGAITTAKLAANAISYTAMNTNAVMYAQVNADGTLAAGRGVTSAKIATGKYLITFAQARTGTGYLVHVTPTGNGTTGELAPWRTATFATNTTTSVTIGTYNTAGTPNFSDAAFNLIILDPQVP